MSAMALPSTNVIVAVLVIVAVAALVMLALTKLDR